ncbi:membrane protease YdiL (CAAX protease family) [Lipingzhangella halophila]|uniref:Membrane protease YdiL (CAAX protease family) n=1 Tax=Lipingzhangella halophila TaxID=1783352 RepID=A0A7W7RG60_9ACTN|nr:CPBP family intramembrane glutamic endopeptidase [Lipingzhangella halophila]MBB4931297.1 membrane protease YdiL (CAAX protease family) [Lipingzhangella halophila]
MSSESTESVRPPAPSIPYRPAGRLEPWAPRFLTVFALVLMAITVALCAPVWMGAMSSDVLNAVTPLVMWLPTLVVVAVHLGFRRPVPVMRWAALGIRPAGRTFAVIGLLLAVMVLVPALTIAAAVSLGLVDFAPSEGAATTALMVVPMIVVMMVTTLGEEAAWRGYLQSTLAPLGFWRSTLAIAAYWSLWHLPVAAAYWTDGQMDGREVLVTSVNLLLSAVVLSAVRYLSGSVWPAVAGHAMLNTVLVFAYSNLITSTADLPDGAYWGYALVTWAVWGLAILVLARAVARRAG